MHRESPGDQGPKNIEYRLDSLLRTFYGKYIKFGSNKGFLSKLRGGCFL